MARPKCCRMIGGRPARKVFKPAGVPMSSLEEIILSMDEFEAIRLADLEGLYQEDAADRMNVSRQTFGRIIADARRKVARVLSEGLALRIQGGEVEMPDKRAFECDQCRHVWELQYGTGRPSECPECRGQAFRRRDGHGASSKDRGNCYRKQGRGGTS